MLPEDSVAQKLNEARAASKLQQGQVDQHFNIIKPEDRPVPYSDAGFWEAAIQWLVQTDQVKRFFILFTRANLLCAWQSIQALEHFAFQIMVQIASCVTHKIKIPNQKQTWAEIILLFKDQMNRLKESVTIFLILLCLPMTFHYF